jgi:hypothetical protein
MQVALFGALLAYWYYQIEFNYIDTASALDRFGRMSWAEMANGVFSGTSEFRPGQAFAIKLVLDLFGPSQFVFRTLELGMLLLVAWQFFRLLPPRSEAAWFGFTVGFCCLFGLHTARDIFVTALPLGHALLVVTILLLGSLLLLRHGPSVWVDVSAFLLSLLAIFHIEAGVIVPAVWLVAGALRLGGARWRTAGAVLTVCVLYAVLRGLTNADPLPGPFYTETGFLFQENLTVAEQQARFTGRAWLFHAYNVIATLLTVLFSEPRAGVFFAGDALVNGTPIRAWQVLNWLTSAASTALIGWAAVGWWRTRNSDGRMMILLGVAVLTLNSALGYLYTRDRIPGLAGVYYALLLGAAASAAWQRRSELRSSSQRMVATAALVILATGWVYRIGGTVLWTRDIAWSVQDEWTDRYDRLAAPSSDPATTALRQQLRQRAVRRVLPNPDDDPGWMQEYFERKH